MTATAMTTSVRKPLKTCAVTVRLEGLVHAYEGLFRSTCDAVIDAMDRFPAARGISVACLHPAHLTPQPAEVTP